MQTPSAADPSFKAFLDKLQEQNNRGLATQLVQLKAERENAGKDNDKREEQLDEVIDSLKEVKLAVTGVSLDIDITPLVNIGENQTRLLEELSKESSLIRKLSEGSVEYDKEAAQYRNTSGKEVESVVTGKTSKKGGFLDFETARDTLSGQGKRVREDNKFDLKPINYVPGRMTGKVTGVEKAKEDKDTVDNSVPDTRGFFATLLDELDAAPGRVRDYLIDHEEKPEVKKKEREAEVSSDRQAPVSVDNPEADNIRDSQEVIADNSKSDLELSKQMLDTTREQLTVLREIRDALTPKTPGELSSGNGPPSPGSKVAETEEGGGLGLGDALTGLGGLAKKAGGAIVRGAKAVGRGALSLGGGIAKFAASGAGKALGATAAVGLGAYTAYKGYTAAEDSKQAKLEEVQTQFDAGKITSEQAAEQRKEIGNTATVEKSGAVGEGTGMAGGAIAGGLAGAKLGAAIGSIIPGAGTVIGAGIGTIAGGALGAFAGSKAGKAVGEYGGKAINAAGSFFGGIGDKVKGAYGDAKTIYKDYNRGIGSDDQPLGTAMADMNMSVSKEFNKKEISEDRGPGFNATTTTDTFNKGIVADKSILGSTTLGGLFTAKGKQSGKFLGTSSDERIVEGKVEGRQINQTDRNYGTMLGKRISGGLLGKDTYKVSSEMSGTGESSAEYDLEVSKGQYNELKELNKKGDVEGARKKLAEIKAKSAENAEALSIASPEEMVSGTATGTLPDDKGIISKAADTAKSIGSSVAGFFGLKDSNKAQPVTSSDMASKVIEGAKGTQGASTEQAAATRSNYAAVDPRRVDTSTAAGATVAQTSTENADMSREANKGGNNNTVVSNNVSNNETTKFMPSKPSPRPEFTGSALDRYLNKTAVY